MRLPFDYANYDPERFLQNNANDENIQRVLESARQLAAITFPQGANETPIEAQRRIEQSFDRLKDQVAAELKIAQATEIKKEERDFVQARRDEITAKYLPGITKTPHLHLKEGGQAAFVAELDKMESAVSDDARLKDNRQQIVNWYAVLNETIPDGIDALRDQCLQRHGLDPVHTLPNPALKIEEVTLSPKGLKAETPKVIPEQELAEREKMQRYEKLFPQIAQPGERAERPVQSLPWETEVKDSPLPLPTIKRSGPKR